jgi:hypothetical protein
MRSFPRIPLKMTLRSGTRCLCAAIVALSLAERPSSVGTALAPSPVDIARDAHELIGAPHAGSRRSQLSALDKHFTRGTREHFGAALPRTMHVGCKVPKRVRFWSSALEHLEQHCEVVAIPRPECCSTHADSKIELANVAHQFPTDSFEPKQTAYTDHFPTFVPLGRAIADDKLLFAKRVCGLCMASAARTAERHLRRAHPVAVAHMRKSTT